MASVKVYNIEGKEVGTMELNDAVFGVEVNEHLMHLLCKQRCEVAAYNAFRIRKVIR